MASRFPRAFGGSSGRLGRLDPFLQLQREVERLFEDAYRSMPAGGEEGGAVIVPAMDVHRTENGIEITVELAGVSQENLDLQLEGDLLTIRAEKRQERRDRQAHVLERSYGSFQRSLQLPFVPEGDRVEADFKDGVLNIKVPSPDRQERSRRIEIGGSGSASQQTIGGRNEQPEQQKPGSGEDQEGQSRGSGPNSKSSADAQMPPSTGKKAGSTGGSSRKG